MLTFISICQNERASASENMQKLNLGIGTGLPSGMIVLLFTWSWPFGWRQQAVSQLKARS